MPATFQLACARLPCFLPSMQRCPGEQRDEDVEAVGFCLLANTVGLGFYLHFVTTLWDDMPGHVFYSDDGPSFVSWTLTAFPFEATCTVINLILIIGAVRRVILDRGWSLMVTWAAVLGAWMVMDLYVDSHIVWRAS